MLMRRSSRHTVGLGPVPRHARLAGDLIIPVGQERLLLNRSGSGDPELQRYSLDREIARDRPSRYDNDAQLQTPQACPSQGGAAPDTVGRGPVPRHARLADRPYHPCRSGAPAPDPFGSRRSRTTEVFV